MKAQRIEKVTDKVRLASPIIDCRSHELTKTLAFLSAFVSDDATRYFLNGIFWDKENKALAASDGRRLAVFKMDEPKANGIPRELIDLESGIYLIETKKDAFTIAYRIDGKFPSYEMIFPVMDQYESAGNAWGKSGVNDLFRIAYSKATFDHKYLLDLRADKMGWEAFFHKKEPAKKVAVFSCKEEGLTALIMPLASE